MFEFEAKGSIDEMRAMETELLEFLGFNMPSYHRYLDLAQHYECTGLEAEHELAMQKDFGHVVSLESFPEYTSPFWNMRHHEGELYRKIDVILYGMETVSSAEREVDVARMREQFFNISQVEQ